MGMRARYSSSSDFIRNCRTLKSSGPTNGTNASHGLGIRMNKPNHMASISRGLDKKQGFALRMLMILVVICIWIMFKRSSNTYADDFEDTRPMITIFSAPRQLKSPSAGYLELLEGRQELAVRSWLALSPDISVVLFGQHPSIFAFAKALGPRVSVEAAIDFTFQGTPFFHSMIHKMQAYKSDISVLVNPEVIILPGFITALHTAYTLEKDWLLISASPNISYFPFQLDNSGRYWLHKNGEHINFDKLQEFPHKYQQNCGENIILAWKRSDVPLHAGVLPQFLYRKGLHNQWFINEALSSDFRHVIDASEAISSFYPEQLSYLPAQSSFAFAKEDTNMTLHEQEINSYLASTYGSLCFQNGTDLSKLLRLVNRGGRYVMVGTSKSHMQETKFPMEVGLRSGQGLHPSSITKWRSFSLNYSDLSRNKCSITTMPKTDIKVPAQLTLPHSLNSLLELVADEHRTVILTIAGESYRDMLMSWVCRLRQLSIRNFLVSAIDIETYHFSLLQGLPVFKDSLAPTNISFNECHFGSECFKRVTKVKSRLVLQILKLGYNVLLSDVDVFWFKNPLPYLRSFGPGVLTAQSDEYKETGPINLPRRLNSGFYFARSDVPTISAIENVVRNASVSGLSEQPSFYDVLCGEEGIHRISDDRCVEPISNLTIQFLDRNLFPNGAYQGLWEKRHVQSVCRKKGCIVLHNNWINGRQRKLERQVRSGLFAYSPIYRTCLQSLQKQKGAATKKGTDK